MNTQTTVDGSTALVINGLYAKWAGGLFTAFVAVLVWVYLQGQSQNAQRVDDIKSQLATYQTESKAQLNEFQRDIGGKLDQITKANDATRDRVIVIEKRLDLHDYQIKQLQDENGTQDKRADKFGQDLDEVRRQPFAQPKGAR